MNFKYDKYASHLKESDWMDTTKYLDDYFLGVKGAIKNIDAKIKISSIWPRFEIVKSRLEYLNVLRFELNPNYLDDDVLSFNCCFLKFKKKFIFNDELISKEDLFVVSKSEISNVEENLQTIERFLVKLE